MEFSTIAMQWSVSQISMKILSKPNHVTQSEIKRNQLFVIQNLKLQK